MSAGALPFARLVPGVSLGTPAAAMLAILFLAGSVHICAILLVPRFSPADGWSRLERVAGEDRFLEIDVRGGGAGVAGLDPLFLNAACRLRLAENPAALTLEARDRFWSLALYDPQGTIIFSLNDRTAAEGRLDMLVLTPAASAVRETLQPAYEDTIVVENQSEELIALLRLFAPTAASLEEARAILRRAECLPEALDTPSSG
jgi:uncharacterized membrane protein